MKRDDAATVLLRSELRDPRSRELAITSFIGWAFVGCAVVAAALLPVIGWKLSAGLVGVLGAGAVLYRFEARAMKRGWFKPYLPWAHVTVEISTPAVLFVADVLAKGPFYALTTPPIAFWGALIMLSGLRARRTLAVYAGTLAALEYGLLYAFMAHPILGDDPPITLQPPMIAVRCLLLFASGILTAVVTTQFMLRAEQALRVVRERDLFGKYILHERIGTGGMAEVYRATYSPEGGFEKIVAVKRVLPAFSDDQEFLTMFRREAELCSRLSHPNIVQVFDLGRHEGTYFLAMEYVDGLSLNSVLKASGKMLPLSAITWLGAELGAALDYAHRRTGADGKPLGLVHRDVNPPNVLLTRNGEVKLSDFGIGRAAESVPVTTNGMIRGKVGYLSPEQVTGEPMDGRSDLFALGATLYEALTGRRAFTADSDLDAMRAALDHEVPPPSVYRPEIPPALDAIILQLLEKEPSRRTSNGAQLRAQFLALQGTAAPVPNGQLLLAKAVKDAWATLAAAKQPVAADVTEKSAGIHGAA